MIIAQTHELNSSDIESTGETTSIIISQQEVKDLVASDLATTGEAEQLIIGQTHALVCLNTQGAPTVNSVFFTQIQNIDPSDLESNPQVEDVAVYEASLGTITDPCVYSATTFKTAIGA